MCVRACECVFVCKCLKTKMLAFDKAHVIVPDLLRQVLLNTGTNSLKAAIKSLQILTKKAGPALI